jgi:hypothetical protein
MLDAKALGDGLEENRCAGARGIQCLRGAGHGGILARLLTRHFRHAEKSSTDGEGTAIGGAVAPPVRHLQLPLMVQVACRAARF